jgi:VanZ family protein
MIIIFLMSSRSRMSITESYVPDFIIFKSLHILEYAILNTLLFRGFYSDKLSLKHSLIYAIIVSIFYAFTDEFHQTYIPTRTGTIRDVLIDSIGILGVSFFIHQKFKKVKNV